MFDRSLFVLTLLALGCTESVESEDVRTTGIYPVISVVADGRGSSTVTVRLKVGGSNSNTYLDLIGDDRLEASVGDTTKRLDKRSDHTYRATFPVDQEGTEFVVAFTRGDADESAPVSSVNLPAPFELELGATSASRADDALEVAWVPPASGTIAWEYEGGCVKGDNGTTPDDGTYALAAGRLETFESDKNESCTVDLKLTRAREGTLDSAFTEGGTIEASQVRSASFTSMP